MVAVKQQSAVLAGTYVYQVTAGVLLNPRSNVIHSPINLQIAIDTDLLRIVADFILDAANAPSAPRKTVTRRKGLNYAGLT